MCTQTHTHTQTHVQQKGRRDASEIVQKPLVTSSWDTKRLGTEYMYLNFQPRLFFIIVCMYGIAKKKRHLFQFFLVQKPFSSFFLSRIFNS